MSTNSIDLQKLRDHRVTISAIAHNAKAGAVVMTDRGEVIYIRGQREWEEAVIGTRVVIEGILRRGRIYPDVSVEGGAISQGIRDEQWYLEVEGGRSGH